MSRARTRTSRMPLSYLGVSPLTPPEFVIRQYPPTVDDYHNFNIGCMWLDEATHSPITLADLYMLVRLDGPRAKWITLAKLVFNTLTGNTGAAVPQNAAEGILIIGTKGLTIIGDPTTYTLTVTTANDEHILQSLTAGSTVYADAVYNIDFVGTAGLISTTGTPLTSTVSVDPDNTIAVQYATNTNTAVPASNVLNIVGSTPIATSAIPALGNNVYIALTNGTDGQLLIGGGSYPAWNTVTTTTGMSKTVGANTLNLEVTYTRPSYGFNAGCTTGFYNVTGDSFVYQCIPNYITFNIGTVYNGTTGLFTAPIDGYYYLNAYIAFDPDYGQTGGRECYMELVAGGITYTGNDLPTHAKITNFLGVNHNIGYHIHVVAYLLTGDTAYVNLVSVGGARTDDIQAPGAPANDTLKFNGYLFSTT